MDIWSTSFKIIAQVTLGPPLWGDACVEGWINIHETLSCLLLVSRAGQWSMLRQTAGLLGNVRFIYYLTIKLWGYCRGQNLCSSALIRLHHTRAWISAPDLFFLIRHFDLSLMHRPLCCFCWSLLALIINFSWPLSLCNLYSSNRCNRVKFVCRIIN